MSTKTLLPLLCAGVIGFAEAAVVVKPVPYEIDGEAFEGLLIYDDAVTTPRPGLLMVPNWLGVTEDSAKKAARAASDKYVVFMADMYGKAVRPSNADEAKAAATLVRSDRPLMRKRAQAAVAVAVMVPKFSLVAQLSWRTPPARAMALSSACWRATATSRRSSPIPATSRVPTTSMRSGPRRRACASARKTTGATTT